MTNYKLTDETMKYIILIMLILQTSRLFAQNDILSKMLVVGQAELKTDQLIDVNKIDANGRKCSALIVVTDLDSLRFTSNNGIVDKKIEPGRYFLSISAEERVVSVFKWGYEPLQINLRDYGLSKLERGRAYQIKITGEKKSDFIPINVICDPEVNEVYVDGKRTQSKAILLAPGQHTLRIEKDGYKTIEEKVVVSDSSTLFKYKLAEVELSSVKISSFPIGAKIYINNVSKGETDKEIYLFPGTYTLKLVKSGFLEKVKTIEVKEGIAVASSDTLKKNTGILKINVSPIDSKILIDGADFTYKTNIELIPGRHKIEISKPGFSSVSEFVDILIGEVKKVDYILNNRSGTLDVSVTPSGSQIRLLFRNREIKKWNGSRIEAGITIGEYTLEASYEGFETVSKAIIISEGVTTKENITLKNK